MGVEESGWLKRFCKSVINRFSDRCYRSEGEVELKRILRVFVLRGLGGLRLDTFILLWFCKFFFRIEFLFFIYFS